MPAAAMHTWWPSARIIAAILRCPQAGQSAAHFAATASIASTLRAGHGPFGGSPTRWRASRGLAAQVRGLLGAQVHDEEGRSALS
jgi:hypothetical protein